MNSFPLDSDKGGKDPRKHVPPPTPSVKQERAPQREHRELEGYLKAGRPYDPAIPPRLIHPQGAKAAHPGDARTSMFISAVFVTAELQEQRTGLTAGE